MRNNSLQQVIFVIIVLTMLLIYSTTSNPRSIYAISLTSTPVSMRPDDDPTNWPMIGTENADYLALKGIYGHGNNRQVIWAGDGHTLIVGGDRGVWLYDMRTPQAAPVSLDEPDLPVVSMALSHDGKSLAVSAGERRDGYGIGGSIRIWDIATRTLKIRIPAETIPISFSPDDTQIIGYGWEHAHFAPGVATTWDVKSGRVLASASSPFLIPVDWWNAPPSTVRFGLHFQAVALIDSHANIGIWSITSKLPDKVQSSENIVNISPNHLITVSPDKQFLAINWANHWLWLFDVGKLRLVDVIDVSVDKIRDLHISPDGKMRAAIEDGAVTLRRPETNYRIAVLAGRPVTNFAFSADDRTLALLTGEKTVDVVDVASGKPRFSLVGHQATILHLAFSPDGRWIATTSEDQTVRLWDANTGQQRRIWYPGDRGTALAFSPDSQILAVSSIQKKVRLWDVNTGRLETAVYGLSYTNFGLSFHSNGLLSVYSDNTLIQWDWKHSIASSVSFPKYTKIIQVSPDGLTTLASSPYGCETPSILIFDNKSEQIVKEIDKCPFYNNVAGYSPDGKLLVSVLNLPGNDGLHGPAKACIMTWDHVIKCLDSINGAQNFGKVAFSQSGRILAAINEEGALVVWRVE